MKLREFADANVLDLKLDDPDSLQDENRTFVVVIRAI